METNISKSRVRRVKEVEVFVTIKCLKSGNDKTLDFARRILRVHLLNVERSEQQCTLWVTNGVHYGKNLFNPQVHFECGGTC